VWLHPETPPPWRTPGVVPPPGGPAAVLFDRDGTLVVDVPYNGDPDQVRLMPGVPETLARLRSAGIGIGVVTNQSGVGRGLLTGDDVRRVHRRLAELAGPIDVWAVCPHAPEAGCACRKPMPGLVRGAAGHLGVEPRDCVVIGDIAADMGAAAAAGARGILVPTPVTLPEEVEAAPERADDLVAAVDLALAGTADPVGR